MDQHAGAQRLLRAVLWPAGFHAQGDCRICGTGYKARCWWALAAGAEKPRCTSRSAPTPWPILRFCPRPRLRCRPSPSGSPRGEAGPPEERRTSIGGSIAAGKFPRTERGGPPRQQHDGTAAISGGWLPPADEKPGALWIDRNNFSANPLSPAGEDQGEGQQNRKLFFG